MGMFKYSNAFIGKKLLEQKGVVSWGIVLMQHPDFVIPEIQPLLPLGLSHCLSVNTNHICSHSNTQTSNFANNFSDFLNVLVGFQSERVTWIVNHLPLLPDPHKIFCSIQTHVNVTLNYRNTHPLII